MIWLSYRDSHQLIGRISHIIGPIQSITELQYGTKTCIIGLAFSEFKMDETGNSNLQFVCHVLSQ